MSAMLTSAATLGAIATTQKHLRDMCQALTATSGSLTRPWHAQPCPQAWRQYRHLAGQRAHGYDAE
jgi:hypothetical protein